MGYQANDMWIKALQIEYPQRGAGLVYDQCAMNFVINDSKNKKKCAYRFFSDKLYRSDMIKEKLEVTKFLQQDTDQWDKFRASWNRTADGFQTGSAQLYSQKTRDVQGDHEGRLHAMRLLLWIDIGSYDTVEFYLRYPDEMKSFMVSGEVLRLGSIH